MGKVQEWSCLMNSDEKKQHNNWIFAFAGPRKNSFIMPSVLQEIQI